MKLFIIASYTRCLLACSSQVPGMLRRFMQVMGSSTGLTLKRVATSIILFAGHVAHMGQESVQGFGGKARRTETTRKTKA
jgi:hypothetical protein